MPDTIEPAGYFGRDSVSGGYTILPKASHTHSPNPLEWYSPDEILGTRVPRGKTSPLLMPTTAGVRIIRTEIMSVSKVLEEFTDYVFYPEDSPYGIDFPGGS